VTAPTRQRARRRKRVTRIRNRQIKELALLVRLTDVDALKDFVCLSGKSTQGTAVFRNGTTRNFRVSEKTRAHIALTPKQARLLAHDLIVAAMAVRRHKRKKGMVVDEDEEDFGMEPFKVAPAPPPHISFERGIG
jgi:hypothetical protein